MADALVSIALEKLTHVTGQKLSLFADATRDLQKLSCTFESIQAVLADAESRQVGEKHVQLWLSRLRHVAYDIEDLVEDGRISGLGDEEGNEDDGNRRKKPRLSFGFAYNPLDYALSRRNVANDIKEIKERLDQIDVERNRFGFSSSPLGGDHSMLVRSQRLTTSLIDESEIIGRENDKETMISRLVSGSSSNEDRGQVQVVAIAGIGGLGKTTLARQLYHDAKVRDHFNQDLYWVCVSEPFDVLRLTKDIIEEVRKETPTRSSLNGLQDELLQLLRGKRYLLVLDDVWNDDADKWEIQRLSLTSGANGSRILVTTRSEKVANTMNANYIHELKGLSDDQSWTLFSGRASGGKREGDYSEFESIGKEIVSQCKGVPLSIKVIGNAMKTKRTVEDWKNVLESKIWSLPQATDKILPALLLTYCHLPPRLKQCFVYCSMFPKDWTFEKDMLIRLWVAQGFIQSEGSREKEDIGGEYFDELVARSMFQEIEENDEGKIICTIHDLLHDLAAFIAKEEILTFFSESKGGKSEECPGSSNDVRHACLYFSGSDDKPSKIRIAARRLKKLRTLWLHGIDKSDSGIIDLVLEARFLRALYFPNSTRLPKSIGELKHLRYLHLPYSGIAELPDTIGKLEHLRYLDLSVNSNIVELPESMGDLRNLHTLNLSYCVKLEKLPRGTGGMVSLRYLDLSHNSNMVELPESMGDLRNLHTLNLRQCWKLKKLPKGIGGMVSLRYLDLSHNFNIVELPESVSDLRNLHTLNFSHCEKLEKLPRGIGGMVKLRDLYLSYNSNLVELPKSASDLRNLHTLNLSLCEKLEKLPRGIGGMVSLGYLNLTWNSNMVELPESVSNLRNLHTLHLTHCGKLEKLPRGIGGIVNLRDLDLSHNSNLVELPESASDLRNLHTLNLSLCEKLEKLPRGIGGMVNLRDLDLSHNSNLVELPESASDLRNLHTLDLSGCRKLKKLPSGIVGMVNLRHLEIKGGDSLEYLPKGLSRISGFRSLSKFTVGGGDEGAGCGMDELQPLNGEEAKKQELWKKQHRRSLVLWIPAGRHDDVETEKIDGMLEGLRPHENLKMLRLIGCTGSKLPSWMDGMRRLRELVLSSDAKLERLPHLPSLKEFYMMRLRNEKLPDEGWERLVALQELTINDCEELKCLPEGLTQLPSLEQLCIHGCVKLESLPEWLGQLKKLKSLQVGASNLTHGWGAFRCLPDSVGQLESLESLSIRRCPYLESLPYSLGRLKALKRLEIVRCEALASLPQGLRHLSLPHELYIEDCPLLSERCKKDGGVDWPNISYIPNIYVTDLDSDSESGVSTIGAAPLDDDAHEGSEAAAPGLDSDSYLGISSIGATPLGDADADEGSEEVDPGLDSDSESGVSIIGSAPLDDDANEGLEEVAPGAAMDLPLDDDASEDPEEVARAAKMDLSFDNVAQAGHAVSPGSEDDRYFDAEPNWLESDDGFQC